MNLALFCSTLPVALLVVDLPPSHSLLLWFGLLRTSSRSAHCRFVSVSIFVALLLNTSSYSAHSWLVSISIFLPLFCSTPRVALLVVVLAPSQSLALWFAQHFGVDLLVVDLSRQSRQPVSTFRAVLKPRLALLAVQLSLAAI